MPDLSITLLKALAAGTVLVGLTQPASAQLTLADAIRHADSASFGNRVAGAEANQSRARVTATLKGILPTARLEAGYIQTTDPIGVFGSTLRQRSVSQASFDPQRLNYPDALGNHQGAVVLEQPVLNADAWLMRRSARYAADAASESSEWVRLSTRVDVIRAYYGTVLAEERVNTLRAASRAAHAHVSQAQALVKQGVATKSDALLASVRAGDVDVQLAEAEGAASNSRRGLSVLLGLDATTGDLATAASALPASDRIRNVIASDTADVQQSQRADVRAARRRFDAAGTNAKRAQSLLLPRVNSFARYDWNSSDMPFADNRNWTVGIVASWTPFTSAFDIAEIRAAAAGSNAARAQADAAQANALLEIAQTRTALKVALARLDIAERSVQQSAEAHRIVSRKYEGGLAQVVEVLDAQAVETQSALNLSQARWSAIIAAAERRRSLGVDPGSLTALDTPGEKQ
jgi:outer membrane protein TolC